MFGLLALAGCPRDDPFDPNAPLVELRLVADGIAAPVALADPNDGTGRLFVVSQTGRVFVIPPAGGILETPFLDLSAKLPELDRSYDERGLLGLAFHPDYVANGRLFAYYSAPRSDATPAEFDSETLLCEFRVSSDPNIADPLTERLLLRISQPQRAHKAGQIAFGTDGYLYLATGDGGGVGDAEAGHTPGIGNAQDLSSLLGKFLRIDVNGGAPYDVPADNPFVGRADARPEIWALGMRNPWRWSFDDLPGGSGRLFAADVGQALREELNIVTRGANCGWRIREGTTCFNLDDLSNPLASCATSDASGAALVDPFFEYSHAEGTAVIGGYVYRGSEIPGLTGAYVHGDFSAGFLGADGRLYAAREADDGTWSRVEIRIDDAADGRLGRYLYAFGRDARGELYVLSNSAPNPSGEGGAVHRIEAAE